MDSKRDEKGVDAGSDIIVAMDFGTSGSAIGIGLRKERHVVMMSPLPEPVKPSLDRVVEWKTDKVPTKVLLKAGSLELLAFGDTAADRYDEAVQKKEASGLLLFENFKMRLNFEDNKQRPSLRAIQISARCGTLVPLLTVLTETLAHFRKSATMRLQQHMYQYSENTVLYVLTVPTAWTHAAKQIMMEAAQAAGIRADRLLVALESESAAVACNNWVMSTQKEVIRTRKNVPQQNQLDAMQLKVFDVSRYLRPGSKWLVADGGGGTFDCTLHSVDEQGKLTNAKHSGGAWGGMAVDQEMINTLCRAFGGSWVRMYQERFPADWRTLCRSMEAMKREATMDTTAEDYRLPLPSSFVEHSGLGQYTDKKTLAVLGLDADPHATDGRHAPADPPLAVSAQTVAVARAVKASLQSREEKRVERVVRPCHKNNNESDSDSDSDSAEVSESVSEAPASSQVDGKEDGKAQAGSDTDDGEWDLLMHARKMQTRVAEVTEPRPPNGLRLAYCGGYLKWSPKLLLSAFECVHRPISAHIAEICEKEKGELRGVFAVGGFCESPVIIDALKCTGWVKTVTDHKDDVLLVQVPNPVTAVLRGAVLYGFDPNAIRSRVLRQTVGCDRAVRWNSQQHVVLPNCEKQPRKIITSTGVVSDPICYDHFRAVPNACIGDVVTVDSEYTDVCNASEPGQTEMVLRFYSTTRTDVQRIDEPGVHYIGRLKIFMPLCEGGLNRQVQYGISFGGPIIRVRAIDYQSGQSFQTSISFLD